MNICHVNRRIAVLPSILLIASAIAVSGCNRASSQRTAKGLKAIAAGPARNVQEIKVNNPSTFIFVIGENHASVAAQQQEIEVLDQLINAHAIDAVLMEGSNGPLDAASFAGKLDKIISDPAIARKYWSRELAAGRIGGGEYVALTHQTMPVVGVEDMTAKAKMEIAYMLDIPGTQERQNASWKRGALVLEKGLQALSAGGKLKDEDAARLRAEIEDYRNATDRAAAASAARHEQAKPVVELSVRLLTASTRAGELQTALAPALETYRKDIASLRPVEEMIDQYNELVRRIDRGGYLAIVEAQNLKERIESAQSEPEVAEAAKRAADFTSRADVKELVSLNEEVEATFKQREQLAVPLKAVDATADAADVAVHDAYGVAANDLSSLVGSSGAAVPGVNSFYRDEAEFTKQEQRSAAHRAELEERDSAMAINAIKYLGKDKHCAALVVGFAHLDGVTAQLTSRGVMVVRCDLPGNDAMTTRWEMRAYRRRTGNVSRLFSSPRTASILPKTRLADVAWKDETLATANALDQLARTPIPPARSSVGPAVPIEGLVKGRDVVVRADPNSAMPEADFGNFVAAVGTVPTRPDWGYEAYDRQAARESVKSLSDSDTWFAYYFRQASGTQRGRVITPNGETALTAFASESPRSADDVRPKRVVLFGEPDERDEAGVLVSPTWRAVRGGNGGKAPPPGDGNGPPSSVEEPGGKRPNDAGNGRGSGGKGGDGNGPRFWGATFNFDAGERIPVYRTINPERAKETLAAFYKQEPAHMGELIVVEEKNLVEGLERFPFTPTRGDYSQTVVVVAQNVAEFRQAVANASHSGKLANKQIALVTCGDAFTQTAALRELMLGEGVLLVWVPDRQITPEAGASLAGRLKRMAAALPAEQRPRTVDQLIDKCLEQWYREEPNDPDLLSLELSSSYVIAPAPSKTEVPS